MHKKLSVNWSGTRDRALQRYKVKNNLRTISHGTSQRVAVWMFHSRRAYRVDEQSPGAFKILRIHNRSWQARRAAKLLKTFTSVSRSWLIYGLLPCDNDLWR
jgi:hypothetical protein